MKQRISATDTDHINSGYYIAYILLPVSIVVIIVSLIVSSPMALTGGIFAFLFSIVILIFLRHIVQNTVNAEIDNENLYISKGDRNFEIPFDRILSVRYFVNFPKIPSEPLIEIRYQDMEDEKKRIFIHPTILDKENRNRFNPRRMSYSRDILDFIKSRIKEFKENVA